MSRIRELAAWPFDPSKYRPEGISLRSLPSSEYLGCAELAVPSELRALLKRQERRGDLRDEFTGLDWRTGLVDLRRLVAFQRRIVLPVAHAVENTWAGLIAVSFARARLPVYLAQRSGNELTLTCDDPNLQVRLEPLGVHGGSPFLEAARYRGRWFLRDGYHRAYALLQAGVAAVPAVILEARTLAELHGLQPQCFPEPVLFSERPPFVRDFLDDALNITYLRPRLRKIIRVTMEESFEGDLK